MRIMKFFTMIFMAAMVVTLAVGNTAKATVTPCAERVNLDASSMEVKHLPGLSFVMVTITLTDGTGPACGREVRLTASRNYYKNSGWPGDADRIWTDTKMVDAQGRATFFVSPVLGGGTTFLAFVKAEGVSCVCSEPLNRQIPIFWGDLPGIRFED